jgi:hypothetical protein
MLAFFPLFPPLSLFLIADSLSCSSKDRKDQRGERQVPRRQIGADGVLSSKSRFFPLSDSTTLTLSALPPTVYRALKSPATSSAVALPVRTARLAVAGSLVVNFPPTRTSSRSFRFVLSLFPSHEANDAFDADGRPNLRSRQGCQRRKQRQQAGRLRTSRHRRPRRRRRQDSVVLRQRRHVLCVGCFARDSPRLREGVRRPSDRLYRFEGAVRGRRKSVVVVAFLSRLRSSL